MKRIAKINSKQLNEKSKIDEMSKIGQHLMVIWKWTLLQKERQTILMPEGAKILTVQVQDGNPQLWALCQENSDVPKQKREIAIYGTGNPVPEPNGTYISSFQLEGGAFVFHAFEVYTSH